MANDSKVETISRLAQWKIESFGPCSFRRSESFKVGIWNWFLSIEKNRYLYVRLFPEPSRVAKDQPPIARFVLRVSNVGANRRPYISPGMRELRSTDSFAYSSVFSAGGAPGVSVLRVRLGFRAKPNRGIWTVLHERLIRNSEDFVWPVDSTFHGRFIIDVEFLDLKIYPLNVEILSYIFNLRNVPTAQALHNVALNVLKTTFSWDGISIVIRPVIWWATTRIGRLFVDMTIALL
ncbi:hypothetical protein ACLOJK_033164 [Asimina triloba]